ncbi:LytTR family DNA-binding domain-containing protein [Carboxylicivirga sp. M1479]|uniref:LytR/AlgR family response regulator transcription factor n=1 Tax=Carboxylicivirga sp. M1479 TaxID=2594476 RepID=UPI0011787105|nr:LytTR family DNA-binding domain-containing protein [Carboxylicivirga sp. M1479]TRX71314.1 response regulator transcription factor [Carboxylicivirga sp. M1479]
MIQAVIIDDDQQMRELNSSLLKENFPEINIAGEADSVDSGIELITNTNPDLVLLDIEIKGGTGFNILQKIRPYNFKLIFITGFNDFAIKAFKFSAIDYILKPVNEFEFIDSINNALEQLKEHNTEQQYGNFLEHYEKKTQNKKIVLRTAEAMHLVDISRIMYCKSDNSYTTFILENAHDIIVSKPMKEYAGLLEEFNFVRPHQSFLVNIQYISKIDKSDGGFVILNNGKEIPVSARKKQALINSLSSS